jgi:hypothetical protein
MFQLDDLFFFMLAVVAGAWCLVGPIVWLVMLNKMKRLDRETETNRGRIRQLEVEVARLGVGGESGAAPANPVAAGGQAAALVERMRAAREKRPELTAPVVNPAPEPLADIWIEEAPAGVKSAQREIVGGTGGLSASGFETASTVSKLPVAHSAASPIADESSTWEEILAGKWLTWVGAIAVVIGSGLFFKYAIDNDWIGPTGRVMIGLLVGLATFAGGAFAMLRNYRWLSQGLVAGAMGILYFSLFAAFKWYEIVPQPAAFAGMVLVTAGGLAFSGYFNAQATAILGLIGGFLTPIMLSQNQDAQVADFSYILILDVGVLGLAGFRKWPAVQVLAFVGTLLMWLSWFGKWWDPNKLNTTVVLMTSFFLLFALLAVWYNVLRRKPADPGDFFLILATPVAYFIGLYGVTKADFSWLHGVMAIGLAGVYLGLGVFSLSRNPAGKNVVLALGGIAASFLTIAAPLQLTGHWIAIAWAAESLLLVELGLRFQQPKLRYAGFGLLVVVQIILFQYTVETLDSPRRFDTRFTTQATIDPLARDAEPGVSMNPSPAAAATTLPQPAEPVPSWTDIFNGRSFSFLASAIVLGVLAWEYRRGGALGWLGSGASQPPALEASPAGGELRSTPATRSALDVVPGILLAAVPLTMLGMLLIESYAAADFRRWIILTFLGVSEVWIAATGLALIALSVTCGPRWLDKVGLGVFALLGVFLVGSSLTSWDQWGGLWSKMKDAHDWWSVFLLNPRGMGFIAALAAAAGAIVIHRRGVVGWLGSGDSQPPALGAPSAGGELRSTPATRATPAIDTPMLLGVFTFLTLLALLTNEVHALGVIRDWGTATTLSITGVWAAYALVSLVLGIVTRSASLRLMALGLLVLTTGKVFFSDVWKLSTGIRYMAFIGLGVSLFVASFLYRRFRGRIREWMTPVVLAVLVPAAMLHAPARAIAQDGGATSKEPPTASRLTHRWPVDTSAVRGTGVPPVSEGLVKIVIPPGIYEHARTDLGDLRLFAYRRGDTPIAPPTEIPYVLIRPQDTSRIVQRKVTLLNLSERAGHTEFLLDLGDTAETVNEINVEVSNDDKNYERAVQVFGADRRDADEWNLVAKSGYLLDVSRPGHQLRVGKLTFPQSRFHFYKVSIDNQDRPPLRITGAAVSDREQVIVPRHEFEGKIISQEQDAGHKETQVIFDLGHDRLPTLGLRLAIGFDGSFYRPVTLEVSDQPPGTKVSWRSVTSGHVYRIDRPGVQGASTELSYAETPARYLRLTISNGDDRPVEIVSATAVGIDRLVVAERRSLTSDAPLSIALYAGSERVTSPSYDLSRTLGNVKTENLTALKLGPAESNPDFKHPTPPKPPWSEENKPMLWAITLGGVLVLGLLTAMLLMKAAKHGPS